MRSAEYICDVLRFPFGRHALPMLAIGTIVSAMLQLAPLAGILGVLALAIWFGYLCATFSGLVENATNAASAAPEFADAGNVVEDVVVPALVVIGVALLSFAPLIVFEVFAAPDLADREAWARVLAVVGIVYFPMAMLAVTVLSNPTAANPVLVLVSIVRTLPRYTLCVGLIVSVYLLRLYLGRSLDVSPLLLWLVVSFAGMYAMMATARALGLLYRSCEDELGWI